MKASIAELVRMPGLWRGGELEHASYPTLPTGHGSLDAELPGRGWPTGTLSEVLHDDVGIGEVTFLAGALARAAEGNRLIAWVNPPYLPYAPALAQCGIPLERCLVARPSRRDDALWTAEQALRSGACGALLLWLGEEAGAGRHDGYAWLRRLQMAAESGRAIAIHFRSTAAESLSTPAHLRVVLAGEGGALRIRIPKRRGPPLAQPVSLPLPRPLSRRVKGPLPLRKEEAREGCTPSNRSLHLLGR
jgi:hypothetical protein